MRVALLLMLLLLLPACALFGPGTPRCAVFFPEHSAQLNAAAQAVVAQAAGRVRDDPDAGSGSSAITTALAARRRT